MWGIVITLVWHCLCLLTFSILIYLSQTTGPIWTKLGRNVFFVGHYTLWLTKNFFLNLLQNHVYDWIVTWYESFFIGLWPSKKYVVNFVNWKSIMDASPISIHNDQAIYNRELYWRGIFLSGNTESLQSKVGWNVHWMVLYQMWFVCINHKSKMVVTTVHSLKKDHWGEWTNIFFRN